MVSQCLIYEKVEARRGPKASGTLTGGAYKDNIQSTVKYSHRMATANSTLKQLFGSGARVRILEILLLNPHERYYQRQLSQTLGLAIRSVQQEMPRLVKAGLLERIQDGNRVYFRANPECAIFPELRLIFLKSSKIAELLRKEFSRKESSIQVAFIYGSYAKGQEEAWSDIDVFVVGELSGRVLAEITSKAADQLGRAVNERLFTGPELAKRLGSGDHFVSSVINEPKIYLVGDDRRLEAILGVSLPRTTAKADRMRGEKRDGSSQ